MDFTFGNLAFSPPFFSLSLMRQFRKFLLWRESICLHLFFQVGGAKRPRQLRTVASTLIPHPLPRSIPPHSVAPPSTMPPSPPQRSLSVYFAPTFYHGHTQPPRPVLLLSAVHCDDDRLIYRMHYSCSYRQVDRRRRCPLLNQCCPVTGG